MSESETIYRSLRARKSLDGLTDEAALEHIGYLTDLSLDLREKEGLEHAVHLSEELHRRDLSPEHRALSQYFLGNAWSNLRLLADRDVWDWEQPELAHETFHFRMALRDEGVSQLPDQRVCQVLTNLGSAMSQIGRPVEAVDYWDRALDRIPCFSMARGAKGYGLSYYATSVYDNGHKHLILQLAYEELRQALSPEMRKYMEGNAHKAFEKVKKDIEEYLEPCCLGEDSELHDFSLGGSDEEANYRRWCLDNRLFLNPLNDLGSYPIAAADVLMLPTLITNHQEGPSGPSLLGLYNQLKQEFVSARYLYYEGIQPQYVHFSDKDVRLYDTLDYPSYSLAVEKMKVAYRMVYSVLDKAAFFLNHYLGLDVPGHKVTFKTVWYEEQSKKKGLAPTLQEMRNWPLRGLFWLSKDLYEDAPDFQDALEPDAQEWRNIRNGLEHRYLKLHEDFWSGPDDDYGGVSAEATSSLKDSLALSRRRSDFEAKALRLLKTVRAALIYLCLAVQWEETRRSEKRDADQEAPGIGPFLLEDDLKI